MACVALKALTKAAGVAIVKAQKEAFDAVHKLLEDFDVDSAVIEALEELTAKFTAGKPKRAKTGYNLFIAEHMKESKAIRQRAGESDLKSVDHMKLACAAWKELADDEQEKYREMARGLVAQASESDFTVEHAQNTYYNLPPHLNKYASSAKPIIIDQKYKVDFNPKATTSHILNNLGMFVLMVVNGGFHLFPLCGKWKGSNVSKADMKALCLRQQVHIRRTTLPTSSTQRWMKETRLVTSRSAGHAPFRRHSR